MTDIINNDSCRNYEEHLDFLTNCMICEQAFQCSKCTHYGADLQTECVISDELE